MGVVKLADYRPQLEVVEHRVADTEDGFMRVANEITDSLLMADLTVRQLKVMLAIMRKTYGFNKPMDRLTNTQIAAMTGIHHTHVCAAKRQLIERKFLIADGVKIGVNKVVSQWISQDSLTLAIQTVCLLVAVTSWRSGTVGITSTGRNLAITGANKCRFSNFRL